MATVIAKVTGGKLKEVSGVYEAQDLYDKLDLEGNYTVTINREPAEMMDSLDDDDIVTFTKSVKGGK